MRERTSRFGRLGIEVGTFGRWSRLAFGVVMLAPILVKVSGDLDGGGEPFGFYLRSAGYLVAIAAAYVAVYRVLSPSLLGRIGPWPATAIFVGPAFTMAWWPAMVEPWAGIAVSSELALSVGAYIGLSFLLQWRIKYGGCEVVALPIALGAARHATYCVPLVVADAVEKQIVDRAEVRRLGPVQS